MTPTARTLAELRKRGYRCQVVEQTIPHTFIKRDLFGLFDVLAIKGPETLAVQVTSGSNVAARAKKIAESEAIGDVRAAGWALAIHGWRLAANGRWVLREVDVS